MPRPNEDNEEELKDFVNEWWGAVQKVYETAMGKAHRVAISKAKKRSADEIYTRETLAFAATASGPSGFSCAPTRTGTPSPTTSRGRTSIKGKSGIRHQPKRSAKK